MSSQACSPALIPALVSCFIAALGYHKPEEQVPGLTSREGPEVAAERSLRIQVALQRQDVDACRIVDAPSAICHCDDLASIQGDELCCPAAHIAKALGRSAPLITSCKAFACRNLNADQHKQALFR